MFTVAENYNSLKTLSHPGRQENPPSGKNRDFMTYLNKYF